MVKSLVKSLVNHGHPWSKAWLIMVKSMVDHWSTLVKSMFNPSTMVNHSHGFAGDIPDQKVIKDVHLVHLESVNLSVS